MDAMRARFRALGWLRGNGEVRYMEMLVRMFDVGSRLVLAGMKGGVTRIWVWARDLGMQMGKEWSGCRHR